MIKHLLDRARNEICDKGIKGYVLHIKKCLYLKPFIDELWYMLNYYLHPTRKVIKKVQRSQMLLDLSDTGINRDLFLYGLREPACTKIFKDELKEGMKVVDIGANIGYYVLMEAQIIGDSGKIYAIEPAPKNFENLKKNIEINAYPGSIELFNLAIADKVGKVQFSVEALSNHCKLTLPDSEGNNTIEVDAYTLDELLGDKEIDFIRMDPEGAEWLILKGMKRVLSLRRPLKLFIEVHPRLISEYGGDINEFLSLLGEAGFYLKYLVTWLPNTHVTIPYIKGKGAKETSIEYNRPLKDLLNDAEARQVLCCTSGSVYEAGYKVFLERK
ncbi:MAG: FkbM family methyltransferase [Candidatus Omnitrophica bacterium]|nr:FkbM family methyltransferase [Candidatus Omnitrophota bacterium]MBU1127559.1 FkbM family methyltransferase [Candidatus Omnitrophota bacterium]MBU1852395.1 FkbM family methyltransferase [Candidatus Omnitrophota bacterium]